MRDNPTDSVTRRDVLKSSAAVSAAALMATLGTNFAHAQGADSIKIGLIGCGGRGCGALGNAIEAAPGVELHAMADLFPDQLAAAVQQLGDKAAKVPNNRQFSGFDAYKGVLASGVNYVILATPPAFRPRMVHAALNAGIHVFAEKPMAVCPAGVRLILEAHEVAEKKKVGLVSGTQRRHQDCYIETIKRLHGGAIGDIIAMQVQWMQGGAWMKPRQPGWSDVEWQMRNWPYFTWLSGDHIVEQHMHQHDVANWVMGGPPRLCIGMGGRQSRTDPAFGHIYDHFAVDYEYTGNRHVISFCRQVDGTYGRVTEKALGTKGWAFPSGTIVPNEGDRQRIKAELNPYVQEHANLINSIRKGEPLNEAKTSAESTLTAIMGRMSAYTGKMVTWQQALNSKLDLLPPDNLAFGPMPAPTVAIPGKDELI
jgi:predicted dehydrogenase